MFAVVRLLLTGYHTCLVSFLGEERCHPSSKTHICAAVMTRMHISCEKWACVVVNFALNIINAFKPTALSCPCLSHNEE